MPSIDSLARKIGCDIFEEKKKALCSVKAMAVGEMLKVNDLGWC